jgi:hypothetical protein
MIESSATLPTCSSGDLECPKSCALSMHGDTLHHMLYYVATALGILDRSYEHMPDRPIYGMGQVSCTSLAVWLIICLILFDCHQNSSHRAEYFNPDDSLSIKLSMAGFVDYQRPDQWHAHDNATTKCHHTPFADTIRCPAMGGSAPCIWRSGRNPKVQLLCDAMEVSR